MTNRLSSESSPYLRQHAENPVDWHPWDAEALALARREGRPILLSIGYAACHWCHVMAHESFEDADTAALMNAHFVNVKVDREERPDLDGIYMQAVQAMTGHGGWPMTVFLTPEGVPFFGGTYFPPADRHGMPSFRRVLASVAEAWRTRRDEVTRSAEGVREMFRELAAPPRTGDGPSPATLRDAFAAIARLREPRFEGLGSAPKFPQAMALDFCLRHWARTGDAGGLEIAHRAFVAMARGGIYDQVGGGFARYSTDARWLVPHFEKMLYDNALLARLGVHLWQATGDPEVRRVTEETVQWVMREMTSPEGGWYSSLDADSEGEEGRFYVWNEAELREALGQDFDACARAWGVTPQGNFEGANILHVADAAAARAATEGLARAKATLLERRARRVRPGLDDKVVASWNGLMVRALAEAGRVFGDAGTLDLARRAGEFLWQEMTADGRVIRAWMPGGRRIGGFLEDHAALGLAFIGLYQATFAREWLDRARTLADSCVRWFWSEEDGAFYDTSSDHEALVVRPRDVADNATPSGTSLAVELQLFVAEYFGDDAARARAGRVLAGAGEHIERMPVMLGHLLGAADMAVHGAVEVAVSGDPRRDDARVL
ncbi:MAG: thioredoxin domain-containing protein, partial [Gemmatimonadota bacterium]|nr:thioredoxin domain-containing protein [Gemmatimonadota bacterium]